MSDAAAVFARWRVRLGYILAVFVLWFARPTPKYVAIGAAIGLLGLWLRAYAAGYLHKQEKLTVTGSLCTHAESALFREARYWRLWRRCRDAVAGFPALILLLYLLWFIAL